MLHTINPYVRILQNTQDILHTTNVVDLKTCLIKACPRRQYSMPTIDEVAALIVEDDYG